MESMLKLDEGELMNALLAHRTDEGWGRLSKEAVIAKIRENMGKIQSFGVKRIGFFGSLSRGDMNEASDIDLVVEFERGKATFRNVAGLVDFLEEVFGRNVDLLTPEGIESIRVKKVKEAIKRELEYVRTG